MNDLLLSNILDVITILVCLFITARVCFVYPKVLSLRLLVLGLSMGIITITAGVDLISTNITNITAHTDWFLYIGQAVAFLCILLSLTTDSDIYLQNLVRIQIFASILLLCLLLFSFTLSDLPDIVRDIVGSTRFIICVGISFYYISGFMKRQTRFSFLMAASFLALAIGYLMDLQQYLVPLYAEPFDAVGDICRLLGFLSLLGAVLGS